MKTSDTNKTTTNSKRDPSKNTLRRNSEKTLEKNQKDSGFGLRRYDNSDVFAGYHQNGLTNALGIWMGTNGAKYMGQWKDSKFHGYGHLINPDGSTYIGDFENGQDTGIGKFLHNDNEFIGNFSNGNKSGLGELSLSKGQKLISGYYDNNFIKGFGIITISSDEIYKYRGDFGGNNKLEGFGEEITATDFYKGQFYDSYRIGIGQSQSMANNSTYFGDWSYDQKNGFGQELYSNQDSYEGQYKNNNKNGIGSYIHKDSNLRYTGNFKDNKRHGHGKLESDSYFYYGKFERDKPNGLGMLKNDTGSYFGEFKDGLRDGLGTEKADTYFYKGEWKADKPTGLGVYEIDGKIQVSSDEVGFDNKVAEVLVEIDMKFDLEKFIDNQLKIFDKIEKNIDSNKQAIAKEYEEINYDLEEAEEDFMKK